MSALAFFMIRQSETKKAWAKCAQFQLHNIFACVLVIKTR
jgi:hypothetical protein